MSDKTILATCYAINPYKGSEDGMGWNFVYQIARYNKVIAITRENNRGNIEKYQKEYPDKLYDNISFLYFDLPYWMRFWKKKGRGALLYYYLWQKGIVSFIKSQKLCFDIAHNVNFHNDWTPSFLWKLDKPTVWGPIGHHPQIPKQYLKPYSWKYLFKDRLTWLVKRTFWDYSSSLKNTVKNTNHILCMNTSVPSHLKMAKKAFSIESSVATQDFFYGYTSLKSDFHIISVGRFTPLKGFDLTLHSYIKFLYALPLENRKKCKLTLVGTGPEKELYQTIIRENNVEKYVEIIEWMERKDLMELYNESSVFLFPSHEGAGMVVAEALSFGLPIVCLNNQGPGEFINSDCGFAVNQLDYDNTIFQLKEALYKLFWNKKMLLKMSVEARKLYLEKYTWNVKGENLNRIYNEIVV